MHIRSLKLANYRNYEALELPLDERLTVLLGENAQGKTNVLESIYLCAAGRSFLPKRSRPFRQPHRGDSGGWEGASRLMRRLLRYSRMQMTSCKQTITYQAMEE